MVCLLLISFKTKLLLIELKAKYLAQMAFLSAQVVGRAFTRALRQELAGI